MTGREKLRSELLSIIATHKEGFKSGTPESARIDALIDELTPLTVYTKPLDHPETFRGHWGGDYFNLGKLVCGASAQNQGVGVTTSLKTFSMGRLPDIPATFLGSGLEIDPGTGAYNFFSHFALGEKQVPAYHFSLASYERREENLARFLVEFEGFKIVPVDHNMSMASFAAAIGIGDVALLSAEMSPRPKLWSDIAYMDDDLRIQLGQLGGHYILFRTDRPMYSIEYWKNKPPSSSNAAVG
ncbi:MAG: hypothetical protein EXR11_04940 [Rhodospirillaceae bacterium]|nr:hypothetical protein [Rhodospirillaceae bacterium]